MLCLYLSVCLPLISKSSLTQASCDHLYVYMCVHMYVCVCMHTCINYIFGSLRKFLEGGSCGLFEGIIPTFAWRNRKTMESKPNSNWIPQKYKSSVNTISTCLVACLKWRRTQKYGWRPGRKQKIMLELPELKRQDEWGIFLSIAWKNQTSTNILI